MLGTLPFGFEYVVLRYIYQRFLKFKLIFSMEKSNLFAQVNLKLNQPKCGNFA